MAKVLSHTPTWLSRPSPGFDFFQPGPQTKSPIALSNGQGKKIDHQTPSRTIASRGTEVFVVVGNEIRWSDLVLLRDSAKEEDNNEDAAASFRASASVQNSATHVTNTTNRSSRHQ